MRLSPPSAFLSFPLQFPRIKAKGLLNLLRDERVPIEKEQNGEDQRRGLGKPWGVRRRGTGQSQVKEKPTEAGLALENDPTPETPRGV